MNVNKKVVGIVVICIWVVITLLRVFYHQPWYDEAHAYILAQNLSIPDLIAEMKDEGHLLVWYLLIMPFAKLKLWYPYPMQIINWLCAFGAILIMWKKAPLHPVTKTIITFSYPFLAELPVVARCYSVGVMLLCLIAALYSKSIKHPIWYSLLILLCANTSVMALFGATAFGLVFAYDLIKSALNDEVKRKDFILSFSIMALTCLLILLQIGSSVFVRVPMERALNFYNNFSSFVYDHSRNSLELIWCYKLVVTMTSIFTFIILFLKNKKLFFIGLFTVCGMMYCFLYKYSGFSQHIQFFWIYALILCWLLISEEKVRSKLTIFAEVLVALFFSILLFSTQIKNQVVYNSHSKLVYQLIEKTVEPNVRVIIHNSIEEEIAPYFENSNIELYMYSIADSVKNSRTMHNIVLNPVRIGAEPYISPVWLEKSVAKDKKTYLLTKNIPNHDTITFSDHKNSITVKKYMVFSKQHTLYEVDKIHNAIKQ